MSEIRDIMSTLESEKLPDKSQVENLLYMYADMPVRFDIRDDRLRLFGELMRLEELCRRCGFPDEAMLFCYKRAFSLYTPGYEQFEKYGISYIRQYMKLYGIMETDEEDFECLKQLAQLMKKYGDRLRKRNTQYDSGIVGLYEAGIYQMLLEGVHSAQVVRPYLSDAIILCSAAGYRKDLSRERAMSFFRTVLKALIFVNEAELKSRPMGKELFYETVAESAALAYEGLASLSPADKTDHLTYYRKALMIRLKCLDRVYPLLRYTEHSARYFRLIRVLCSEKTDIVSISEFADGFDRLYRAYKGVRDEKESALYKEISRKIYDILLSRSREETKETIIRNGGVGFEQY